MVRNEIGFSQNSSINQIPRGISMKLNLAGSTDSLILIAIVMSTLFTGVYAPTAVFDFESANDTESVTYEQVLGEFDSGSFDTLASETSNGFPHDVEINVTSAEGFMEGYNLFTLVKKNRTDFSNIESSLLITDMEGNIVSEIPNASLFSNDIMNSTSIIYSTDVGDPKANIWNYYDNETLNTIVEGHHEFEYNPISNTIFTFKGFNTEVNGTLYRYDHIVEYDLEGNLVWWLNTHTFVPIEWKCPFPDFLGGNIDITHSNSLFFDSENDVLYFNARNINTFFKINHTSGEVMWGVGEHGNFTLFDSKGVEKESLFYHAHAVEQVDNDTFILFDNDLHNQTDPNNEVSRILEITIDETTMTANESWSWSGSSVYYSRIWGDADRLANGNRLGTFGTTDHPGAPDIGARLVEVTDAGEIVWEMNFPSTTEYYYGVYRVERLRFAPYLSIPQDRKVLHGNNVTASWNAWYNFRPKITVEGTFELLLNDTEIANGSVFYDKLWRSTNLTYDLGALDLGLHNVTLIVYDDIGNYTSDSIMIDVVSFYISREGPLDLEYGIDDSTLTWFGETEIPLTCNLTVNGTLEQDFEWTGANITLGLLSYGLGTHEIVLQLFNNTDLVYTDSFSVITHPAELPTITPLISNEYSIRWNQTGFLRWDIFDNSPDSWELYVNGAKVTGGTWNNRTYQVSWKIPTMN
ncbi:MAG: aryl-sulfate sulfotransferase [Candidatus Thorarchaeota archaeon]|jgi:hypothetical protein